jgi:hypothetical protein
MRKVFGTVALLTVTLAISACTRHHAAPNADEMTRLPAATETARPTIAKYSPCTAPELTGLLGVIGLGAGQYRRNLVLSNTSGQACTLTGGPSEITGVRRDGSEVRLATGASRGGGQLYGVVGPANLQPGQTALAVVHTTDMCPKAIDGQVDNFIALKVGISHSGAVRIDFPPGQPYNAICGVDVSVFGISTRT